jgi:uncharacterized beta-barrel protein YwiB (DUF1934 family)
MTEKKVRISIKSSMTDLMAAKNPDEGDIKKIMTTLGEEKINLISLNSLTERVLASLSEQNTEKVSFRTEGILSFDEKTVSLSYNEDETSGMEGSVTRLVFNRDDRGMVSMIREGQVSSSLVFSDTDRRQLCMYDTGILPPFEICVYTRDIVNEINENGGYIELDYLIELRGVSMQYSHIRVEAEEQIVSQKNSYVYEREYETP